MVMKTIKWIAGGVVVSLVVSLIAGCVVEARRPYHTFHRPVIVVPVR